MDGLEGMILPPGGERGEPGRNLEKETGGRRWDAGGGKKRRIIEKEGNENRDRPRRKINDPSRDTFERSRKTREIGE